MSDMNDDEPKLDDIEIAIPGDEDESKKPEAKAVDAKPEPAGKPEGDGDKTVEPSLEDTVETLKTQLAASEAARQAAERRAGAAEGDANRAAADAHQRNMDMVGQGIEAAKSALATAKKAYAEAMDASDWTAAADAQEAIAKATNSQAQLEAGLAAMKAQGAPQRAPTNDPVEQVIRERNMAPRAAEWLRAHPDYITDPRKNQRLLAAHNMAMTDGVKEGSDEYYDAVEGYIGMAPARRDPEPRREDDDEALSGAGHAKGGRVAAPPAAPVSRNPRNGDGAPTGSVRLTGAQREAAHMSWPELSEAEAEREYAKQLRRAQREGAN